MRNLLRFQDYRHRDRKKDTKKPREVIREFDFPGRNGPKILSDNEETADIKREIERNEKTNG